MIIDTSVSFKHPHYPEDSTEGALLRGMDEAGVERAFLHHFGPVANFRFEEANEEIARVARSHPDRFIGIGSQNYYRDAKETERCLNELGLKGVKLFSSWGLAPGTGLVERYFYPIAEKVREAGAFLMIEHEGHTPIIGGAIFWDTLIAKAFPDLPIVMCRCWSWGYWPDYLMAGDLHPNLLLEFTLAPTKLLGEALRRLGPERMVMGSWAPEMDPRAVVEAVRSFPISEEGKRKILGENAAKLISKRRT